MQHHHSHEHRSGDDIIFKLLYSTDRVYGQGIVSIVFRQPLDDILAQAEESCGTARSQLARILEKADGVECLRFHRYSIDIMHAQTYSGDEIRMTIEEAFTSIGCSLIGLEAS